MSCLTASSACAFAPTNGVRRVPATSATNSLAPERPPPTIARLQNYAAPAGEVHRSHRAGAADRRRRRRGCAGSRRSTPALPSCRRSTTRSRWLAHGRIPPGVRPVQGPSCVWRRRRRSDDRHLPPNGRPPTTLPSWRTRSTVRSPTTT
ncbi:hypothetical protein HBB16_04940 [Pseudonocardia sp. MCCB 268]|nr:hypothetical protein [Pseudonocardia cytotoxica]